MLANHPLQEKAETISETFRTKAEGGWAGGGGIILWKYASGRAQLSWKITNYLNCNVPFQFKLIVLITNCYPLLPCPCEMYEICSDSGGLNKFELMQPTLFLVLLKKLRYWFVIHVSLNTEACHFTDFSLFQTIFLIFTILINFNGISTLKKNVCLTTCKLLYRNLIYSRKQQWVKKCMS